MKGIVFTEFLDLVEDKFGLKMVDDIINSSDLPSGGAYTAVGTYDFGEMHQLITHLSANTKIPVNDLLLIYGEHFFSVIEKSYPAMLQQYDDPIEMLASIENHIHVEVRKIYHDAELPTFEVLEKTADSLKMIYKSSRSMHSFGLGLMKSTFRYFEKDCKIECEPLKDDGTEVEFSIKMMK